MQPESHDLSLSQVSAAFDLALCSGEDPRKEEEGRTKRLGEPVAVLPKNEGYFLQTEAREEGKDKRRRKGGTRTEQPGPEFPPGARLLSSFVRPVSRSSSRPWPINQAFSFSLSPSESLSSSIFAKVASWKRRDVE